MALFARLATYPNQNLIPPSLAAQAVAAAGGGAKGIAMLANIQHDQAAIESVLAGALQLERSSPTPRS